MHTHDWTTQRLEARLGSTFGNVYHIDQHDDSVIIRHGATQELTSTCTTSNAVRCELVCYYPTCRAGQDQRTSANAVAQKWHVKPYRDPLGGHRDPSCGLIMMLQSTLLSFLLLSRAAAETTLVVTPGLQVGFFKTGSDIGSLNPHDYTVPTSSSRTTLSSRDSRLGMASTRWAWTGSAVTRQPL